MSGTLATKVRAKLRFACGVSLSEGSKECLCVLCSNVTRVCFPYVAHLCFVDGETPSVTFGCRLCSSLLCNTGVAQGGWSGRLAVVFLDAAVHDTSGVFVDGEYGVSRLAADSARRPFPKGVTDSGPRTRTTSSVYCSHTVVCFSTALQSVVSDTRVLAAWRLKNAALPHLHGEGPQVIRITEAGFRLADVVRCRRRFSTPWFQGLLPRVSGIITVLPLLLSLESRCFRTKTPRRLLRPHHGSTQEKQLPACRKPVVGPVRRGCRVADVATPRLVAGAAADRLGHDEDDVDRQEEDTREGGAPRWGQGTPTSARSCSVAS